MTRIVFFTVIATTAGDRSANKNANVNSLMVSSESLVDSHAVYEYSSVRR